MAPLSQRCCQSASARDNGGVDRTNAVAGTGAGGAGTAAGRGRTAAGRTGPVEGAGAGPARAPVTAGTSGAVGANLPALRSHNMALVLDLLRTAVTEGISRLELAERTGLTPQAVSKITARLRADGLAAEAGRRASTGGKPRTVLRLVPEAGHAVGLHLDRDELRAVLVDLTGAVAGERRISLDLGAGPEAVVGAVAAEAGALAGGAPGIGSLLGIGVALPGPLDHTRGVLHRVT